MASTYIEVKKNNNLLEEAMGGAVVRSVKGKLTDWQESVAEIVVEKVNPETAEFTAPVFVMEVQREAISVDYAVEAVSQPDVIVVAKTNAVEMGTESNGLIVGNTEAYNAVLSNASFSYSNGADVVFVGKDAQNCSFSTGAGEDIINVQGTNNTIFAGADNDMLMVGAGNGHKLYGEAGNDMLLVAGGTGHLLNGGAGNDDYVISNLVAKGSYVIEQNTAGNKDRDILSLTQYNAKDFTFKINKNDELIITNANGATITVKDWKNHALAAIELKDGTIAANDINASVKPAAPTTAIGVIQSFMASLDVTVQKGFAAVDEAVAACSNGLYSNLTSLVNSFINDCLKHSGSSVAERKAFLQQYCGINLDNADTGAITGSDAGGKVTKTAESIVKESVGINGFTYNYNNFKTVQAVDLSGFVTGKSTSYSTTKSFYGVTINGVTLYWNESNWGELGINTNVIRQVVGGIINTWVKDGLNLIEESYGLTLNNPNSTLQRLSDGTVGLQLYFTNSTTNTAIASINSSRYYSGNITTKTFELMNVNLNYYMNGCGNENGASSKSGAGYLDRTIAHELTHAVMAANINSHGSLPVFIKEGMSELTHGIDDQRVNSILNLVNTAQSGGLEAFLRKTFNLTSTSATNSTYTYAGGYALLRYLAKQVADASGKMENSMSYSLGDLLDTSSYDSYIGFNMSEAMSQTQDAMASFADSTVDFGSALDIASYSTNKDTMVYGNC